MASLNDIVNQGTGYETLPTSKAITKELQFTDVELDLTVHIFCSSITLYD